MTPIYWFLLWAVTTAGGILLAVMVDRMFGEQIDDTISDLAYRLREWRANRK